jgi:hypothetical protein
LRSSRRVSRRSRFALGTPSPASVQSIGPVLVPRRSLLLLLLEDLLEDLLLLLLESSNALLSLVLIRLSLFVQRLRRITMP